MDRIIKLTRSLFSLTVGIACGTLAIAGILLFALGIGLIGCAIAMAEKMED